MNKQELIDKAVEDLKGVLPPHTAYTNMLIVSTSLNTIQGKGKYDIGSAGTFATLLRTRHWELVCSVDKFIQRAKELGWINGYKWGVEYETNGKKPALPDDIQVSVSTKMHKICEMKGSVDCWSWCAESNPILTFRIVDKRYKPVEATPEVMPVSAKPITNFDDCSIEMVEDEIAQAKSEFAKLPAGLQDLLQTAFDKVIVNMEAEAARAKELEKKRVVDAVLDAIDGKGIVQNEFILKKHTTKAS
jgi:hypothetical protein